MRVLTICYCALAIAACSDRTFKPAEFQNLVNAQIAQVAQEQVSRENSPVVVKHQFEDRGASFELKQDQDSLLTPIAPISVMGPDWHAESMPKANVRDNAIAKSLEKPLVEKHASVSVSDFAAKSFSTEPMQAEISEDQITSMVTFH
jgi:hypothetical protein